MVEVDDTVIALCQWSATWRLNFLGSRVSRFASPGMTGVTYPFSILARYVRGEAPVQRRKAREKAESSE